MTDWNYALIVCHPGVCPLYSFLRRKRVWKEGESRQVGAGRASVHGALNRKNAHHLILVAVWVGSIIFILLINNRAQSYVTF